MTKTGLLHGRAELSGRESLSDGRDILQAADGEGAYARRTHDRSRPDDRHHIHRSAVGHRRRGRE